MKNLNVSRKIALGAAALGVVFGLFFGLTTLVLNIQSDIDLAKENTRRIITTTLPQVSNTYWQVEIPDTEKILTALLEDELIVKISLTDPLISDDGDTTLDPLLSVQSSTIIEAPLLQRWLQRKADRTETWRYKLASPRDDTAIGDLSVNISLAPVYQRISNRSIWVLLFTILQSLIVSGLMLFIAQYVIIKPVAKLISIIEKIGHDKRPIHKEIKEFTQTRHDEIGSLSKSFYSMVIELDGHQKNLENLVETRTKELVIARNEALEASRAKTQFLANISHELRTPLNAILGLSDILVNEPINARKRRFATDIKIAANQLSKDVDAVLDFSKIEADRLELEQIVFSLDEVIDDVIYQTRALLIDSDVVLSYFCQSNLPSKFFGDPVRIRQILLNLTSNAVKFTQSGDIKISVTSPDINADIIDLDFRISDTGIGLTTDQLSTVFHSFSQADSSISREYGGTGLGLTIARDLAQLMGGTLIPQSTLHKGSEFRFSVSLPVKGKQENRRSSKTSVLILGGESDTLSSIESMCERSGIKVKKCKSLERLNSMKLSVKTVMICDAEVIINKNVEDAFLSFSTLNPSGLLVLLLQDEEPPAFLNTLPYPVDILIVPVGMRELASAIERLNQPTDNGLVSFDGTQDIQDELVGKRILLAEDNLMNQKVAIEHLRTTGATVFGVKNGEEAVTSVKEFSPDLILMDVHMPVMDGFKATQTILKKFGRDAPPIIALTANTSAETKQKCFDAGMQDFLSKPVEPSVLRKTAINWINAQSRIQNPEIKTREANLNKAQYINEEKGMLYADGKEYAFVKNLERFILSQDGFLDEMKQLILDHQYTELHEQLHKIKGSLAIIGAEKLSGALQALENVGAISDPEFRRFEKDYLGTMDAISMRLTTNQDNCKDIETQDLERLFKNIREKCTLRQMDVLDSLPILKTQPAHSKATRLIKALEAVDFDAALAVLDTK